MQLSEMVSLLEFQFWDSINQNLFLFNAIKLRVSPRTASNIFPVEYEEAFAAI